DAPVLGLSLHDAVPTFDPLLLAQLDDRGHEGRVAEPGDEEALVRLVERARVPRGVGGDHPPLDAQRRQRPPEAAQQLDPPAGGGDEDRDGPARRAGGVAHSTSVAPSRPDPGNSGRVAWPSWLMPSRRATLATVAARMRRSSASDRLSTYQTSMSSCSSQPSALRPLAWAQPVRPGRTSCRRAWCAE